MSTSATRDERLDARYGRSPHGWTPRRIGLAALVGAVAVGFAAWLLWAGVNALAPAIEAKNISFAILSDSRIEIRYEVSVPPEQSASCALQALNDSFTVVGWKIVELPASTQRVRAFTDTLRTIEPSTNGLIYRCWAT